MKHLSEESCSIREKRVALSKLNLKWESWPRRFLIIHKDSDLEFIGLKVEELIRWLFATGKDEIEIVGVYPAVLKQSLQIKSDDNTDTINRSENNNNFDIHNWNKVVFFADKEGLLPTDSFDLIITLGGDGTVLLAAWLFQGHAPPIVPFHFGTLGFLNVFNWEHMSSRMDTILNNGSRFNSRMRLNCKVYQVEDKEIGCPVEKDFKIATEFNVLNEIVVERGASPFMSVLEIFGDEKYLTTVQADGVAIATPTGSTAYSLSAGGSVVHPDVTALLVTPICPHSLSFRPLIVPENIELKIVVSSHNRGNVWVSFDGRSRLELKPDDYLIIHPSSHPIITLCRENQTSDWFQSLSKCLHWNER